jgi:hypothetical protein
MAQEIINLGTVADDGTGDNLRVGGQKINDNFTELYGKRSGVFDYSDLGTTSSPISVTGGAGFVYLTNDELGASTNKLYKPNGVTDVWNAATNEFDFSELPLGSKIEIRLDLSVTTANNNTQVDAALDLGIGGSPYTLQWVDIFEKKAGVHSIVSTSFIYIGDTNTQNNPAKFKIESDLNTTVVVNGWACYIHLY